MSVFDDIGNPHYGGGGPVVVQQIAKRLARDYRVTVYSASYKGSRSQIRDGVRYIFLPVGWAGPRGGQLLFQCMLPLVALAKRPNLWIETLTPPFSASLLPVVSRRPVIGLVQMLSGVDMARKYKLPFPLIERQGLKLYEHFIVLNETDRATVRRSAKRATCAIIPNGADRPQVADSQFGRGDHILYLGRIDVEQKGLDLLLAAVHDDPPALPLVIAGSGVAREEKRLRQLAAPFGERVRLAGRVDGRRKAELLRNCAFVVVPSRFETFSLSALEAITHGKPVVCFDLPQLDWIASDCALRVPPFDIAALGKAIVTLAADATQRAAIGRRAYALGGNYDWDVITDRYREVVAATLDRR
ncbi:glycosyltransferase family 4 protein [Dactylosporangium sp. CA-092794]|uniref:glycosyltransferase family 4 protein n=1 Tax=Dactylosporangium sp. CA-092794 TaxID=3239929 RepID=UPI003D8DF3EA